jgi:hypothetical protein
MHFLYKTNGELYKNWKKRNLRSSGSSMAFVMTAIDQVPMMTKKLQHMPMT